MGLLVDCSRNICYNHHDASTRFYNHEYARLLSLKEVTEASMIDAVDYAYYREHGEVKINKEKFVENFLRRFSETMNINKTYRIDFYGIYESPPKVSVKISTTSNTFTIARDQTSFDIVNKLDAILELKQKASNYEQNYQINSYVGN
jgi:hypothetical protein